MKSSRRILLSSLVLGCAVGACSGGAGTSDSGSGGTNQASGGASSSGGSSGGGTGGTVNSTGGTSSVGTGGSGATGGTGGSIQGSGGNSAGGTTGAGGTGPGSGGTTGAGGTVIGGGGRIGSGGSAGSAGGRMGGVGGSGGAAIGSGGSGGKPDQSGLPAVTVHLAGDSTMSDYAATTTQEGWGQELGQFFISKVTIDNQAEPGANIQTFYSGRWKTLINNVKAGDYVLAAFGINDSGTTHGPVTPADFQTQMGVMADEVAAKKATFIPTTSSPLQVWVGGKETNMRLQPYCDATIAVGMMKSLLVDDLNARGVEYYNMIGQTAAAALTFNGDKAHFDKAGATEMAQLAAQELMRINSPLAAYLK
jgi:lysophospholipase L1-like esterase